MTTPIPRRRARTRAIAASLATAVALVLAAAAPAGATVNVTGGPTWTNGQTVIVSGDNASHPTATHVTISNCEITTGITPGTACSTTGAIGFTALTPGTPKTYSLSFDLDADWSVSWDFTVNPPVPDFTHPVTCANSTGTPTPPQICGVVVSYYNSPNYPNPGPITQVSHETFTITY